MLPLTEWITTNATVLSREQVDDLVAQRNGLRQRYYDYFNSLNLDVILCPAGPAPAQPLGTTKYWAYTSMWNLLDWPAAVFPTGLSVGEQDREDYPEPNNEDERHLYATCKSYQGAIVRKLMTDSAEVAAGSPIGLQVVAPRWQDERLMAALDHFDGILPLA